jgi:hypothetical protein
LTKIPATLDQKNKIADIFGKQSVKSNLPGRLLFCIRTAFIWTASSSSFLNLNCLLHISFLLAPAASTVNLYSGRQVGAMRGVDLFDIALPLKILMISVNAALVLRNG